MPLTRCTHMHTGERGASTFPGLHFCLCYVLPVTICPLPPAPWGIIENVGGDASLRTAAGQIPVTAKCQPTAVGQPPSPGAVKWHPHNHRRYMLLSFSLFCFSGTLMEGRLGRQTSSCASWPFLSHDAGNTQQTSMPRRSGDNGGGVHDGWEGILWYKRCPVPCL